MSNTWKHRTVASSLCLVGATVVTVGCGPSVHALYEGDVRFEHCYRLDLDRRITPSHREACWRQWAELYSYGQTRDRIEYAERRLRYLQAGETSPPALRLHSASMASVQPAEAPAPTSVHAPPPPTVPKAPPTPPPPTSASGIAVDPLPRASCSTACGRTYRDCMDPCVSLGDPSDRCAPCERDYEQCMRRCFD